MSLRIADKSTCSADGFGWLEACTNLMVMMIYMMTMLITMMVMGDGWWNNAIDHDNGVADDHVDHDGDYYDDDNDIHLNRSLTGGSGQEGWWTIGSGENHSRSSLFS